MHSALPVISSFARVTKSPKFRYSVLAGIAFFVLFEVMTRSVTAYFAATSPETALRLRSTYPAALLNLAEAQLNRDERLKTLAPIVGPAIDSSGSGGADRPADNKTQDTSGMAQSTPSAPIPISSSKSQSLPNAQIQSMTELALRQEPLNARAFRLLGQLSSLRSDDERTKVFMQAAVRRSRFESIAVYWMLRKSYVDQDYRAALGYADILLRTRPQAITFAMPMFGKVAEIPNARYELKRLLNSNPPWRQQFFSYLPSAVTDARTPLELLLDLKDTPTPPTTLDLSAYLRFLVDHGFYELAYYTWLQFLSPEQLARAGQLFNGGFETVPSGLPFDWVFTKGSGVTIQIASIENKPGRQALSLQFGPGRVDYPDVTQLVLLPPGSYRFSGRYKSELISERGLEWRITCAGDKPEQLGQSQAVKGSTSEWKDFEFSFTVPETNCPAQYARLVFDARSASERFISGAIRYGDLRIISEPRPGSEVAN